jgi:hypothetical protein
MSKKFCYAGAEGMPGKLLEQMPSLYGRDWEWAQKTRTSVY